MAVYKSKYRYERKYYVLNDNLEALRKRLLPFVKPDIYTSDKGKGVNEYRVQSIYFDTPNMKFYAEKKEGIENRNKFRIRVYDDYIPGCMGFLEIKRKTGNRISKNRAPFHYDRIKDLLYFGDIENTIIQNNLFPDAVQDATYYMYHHVGNSLRPVNLVVYEREAYMGLFDRDIRITFDKNVRTALYPEMNEIFSCDRLKYLNPRAFVLEVKYSEKPPVWVFNLIEEFSLNLKAISKYADGIDTHTGNRMRLSPLGFTKLNYI